MKIISSLFLALCLFTSCGESILNQPIKHQDSFMAAAPILQKELNSNDWDLLNVYMENSKFVEIKLMTYKEVLVVAKAILKLEFTSEESIMELAPKLVMLISSDDRSAFTEVLATNTPPEEFIGTTIGDFLERVKKVKELGIKNGTYKE